MDLHRAADRPDWELVTPAKRNVWQRLAATTNGIITPANFVSVIGLGLVIAGLIALAYYHYLLAILLVAVGRLFDVLDGWLAAKTGTKSSLGAAIDVVIDKTATYITVICLFMAKIAPAWLLSALVVPQIIIMLITLIWRAQGRNIFVSRLGKYNLALTWISLTGLILVQITALHSLSPLAYGMAIVSAVINLYTIKDYFT